MIEGGLDYAFGFAPFVLRTFPPLSGGTSAPGIPRDLASLARAPFAERKGQDFPYGFRLSPE